MIHVLQAINIRTLRLTGDIINTVSIVIIIHIRKWLLLFQLRFDEALKWFNIYATTHRLYVECIITCKFVLTYVDGYQLLWLHGHLCTLGRWRHNLHLTTGLLPLQLTVRTFWCPIFSVSNNHQFVFTVILLETPNKHDSVLNIHHCPVDGHNTISW